MSFGVDTLGGLTEKLKLLVNDTQNLYESFIDANQLYKQGKMNDKEFFFPVLGLPEPWEVEEVKLDLGGKKGEVRVGVKAGTK